MRNNDWSVLWTLLHSAHWNIHHLDRNHNTINTDVQTHTQILVLIRLSAPIRAWMFLAFQI